MDSYTRQELEDHIAQLRDRLTYLRKEFLERHRHLVAHREYSRALLAYLTVLDVNVNVLGLGTHVEEYDAVKAEWEVVDDLAPEGAGPV